MNELFVNGDFRRFEEISKEILRDSRDFKRFQEISRDFKMENIPASIGRQPRYIGEQTPFSTDVSPTPLSE